MITPLCMTYFFALLLQPTEEAQRHTLVTFVMQGTPIQLTRQDQVQIAERVRELIVGCAINSVSSPDIFAGRRLATEWQETRASSHLYVRFPQALVSRRGPVQILEVIIGFHEPTFIGPELTRYRQEVIGHVKCDGHRSLALMCGSALRPHLLSSQRTQCAAYDRLGEPR